MKEKPIIFSPDSIQAILGGRKTQTRQVLKPQPSAGVRFSPFVPGQVEDGHGRELRCPYGVEHLWVRESFQLGQAPNDTPGQGVVRYADGTVRVHPELPPERYNWARIYRKKSSIFMPRWASRITLQVTSIRCERLREISERDFCLEMGCATEWHGLFGKLWDSINAKRGFPWEANPWVWIVEFALKGGDHAKTNR